MGTGVDPRIQGVGLAVDLGKKVTNVRTFGEHGSTLPSAGTEPNAHRRRISIASESTVGPIVVVGKPALNILAIMLSMFEELRGLGEQSCRA
jgi:hypothetical protein